MKIRRGFVTNSSSSSFIIARDGDDLSPAQQKVLLDFCKENLLGEKFLTPDEGEETWMKKMQAEYIEDERAEAILSALRSGKTVYLGRISYEECEYVIADQVSKLFENLAKADPNKMVIIDGDLSY